jgi:hypothetical protein
MKPKMPAEDAAALAMRDWIAPLHDEASIDQAGGEVPGDGEFTRSVAAAAPGEPTATAPDEPGATANGASGTGTEMRAPIARCELAPCISRYSHPAAIAVVVTDSARRAR